MVALLVSLIVFSAQAWASHVDRPAAAPATAQGAVDHAHSEASVFGDNADSDQAMDERHSDHCCHASAHLIGLGQDLANLAAIPARDRPTLRRGAYQSPIHPPLIDPPIA